MPGKKKKNSHQREKKTYKMQLNTLLGPEFIFCYDFQSWCLIRFRMKHHGLGGDQTEGIVTNAPLDTLSWIDHHNYCFFRRSLKTQQDSACQLPIEDQSNLVF